MADIIPLPRHLSAAVARMQMECRPGTNQALIALMDCAKDAWNHVTDPAEMRRLEYAMYLGQRELEARNIKGEW